MQNAYTTIYLFKHHLSRFFPSFSHYFRTKKANTEIFVKKHIRIFEKTKYGLSFNQIYKTHLVAGKQTDPELFL